MTPATAQEGRPIRPSIAEIIDAAARARLALDYESARRCPSPANVAALQSYPPAWVAELGPIPGDRRVSSRQVPVMPARRQFTLWEWLCWYWFLFLNGVRS